MRIAFLLAVLLLFAPAARAQTPDPAAPACQTVPGDYSDKPDSLARRYEKREADMKDMDANCDGILQPEELTKGRQGRFEAADANGDGVISDAEAKALALGAEKKAADLKSPETLQKRDGATTEERLKDMDADKDGQVSQAEYEAYYKARAEKLDKNKDGSLDIGEYRTDTERNKHKKKREEN